MLTCNTIRASTDTHLWVLVEALFLFVKQRLPILDIEHGTVIIKYSVLTEQLFTELCQRIIE